MTLAIRQHTTHDSTNATNVFTFASGVLAGSVAVFAYSWEASGGSTSLSDSSGDTPSYAFSTAGIYDGNATLAIVGAFFAPTAGVTAFTATFAGAINSHIEGYEVTGFTGTASFDKTNSTTGQAASPVLSGTTGTLSQAAEFAVGYATDYSAFNGVGSGWTDDGRSSFLFNSQAMSQITAATTAINATATSAGPVFAMALVATIQGPTGGGGSPLRFNANLDGLGASGGFFRDPLAGRSQTGWRPSLILLPRKRMLRPFDRIAA